MAEYILKDEIIKLINEDKVDMSPNILLIMNAIGNTYDAETCFKAINDTCDRHIESVKELPAADVVPVVHGEWVDEGFYADGSAKHAFHCSNCGHHIIEWKDDTSNYCPNCGARMDGET